MITVNGKELNRENFRDILKPAKFSLQEQIDMAGELKEIAGFVKLCEGILVEAMKAREGEWEDHGLRFQATKVKKSRTSLDTGKVKEEMGDEWYQAHCKTTEYEELRITRIPNGEPK